MRIVLVALACSLTGLGTGFLLGRASAAPASIVASAPSSSHASESSASTTGPPGASSAPSAHTTQSDAALLASSREERLRVLEQEVLRLRGTVNAVEAQRREIEGTAIAFPPGRSAKEDERVFHASLDQALAARGLDGEVQAIDCSEFPCIAHGTIRKEIDDATMKGIADDAKRTLGWGAPYLSLSRFVDDKNPTKSTSAFSVAIYPDDLPKAEQQNMNKRLRDRKNAYTDTAGD